MIDDPSERATSGRRRVLFLTAAVIPAAMGIALIVTAAALFGASGRDKPSDADVAGAMKKAGCTLRTFSAQSRAHVNDIDSQVHYNSFPPTSGPHYFAPVDWGFYFYPLVQVQLVHNLEHGGIAIQFGTETDPWTVRRLVQFYLEDPHLLIVAPLPRLGKKIALAAWTVPPRKEGEPPKRGVGRLAVCAHVVDKPFRAFVDAYRDRGPETEPPR